MKPVVIRLLVVTLWLAMLLALLRYEAWPERFTGSVQGYRGLVARELLLRDTWSRILIDGVPGGYGHTNIGVDETIQGNAVEIENRTVLRVALMGRPQNINVRTILRLDPRFHLSRFETRVTTRDHALHVTGERIDERDDRYALTVSIGDQEHHTEIRIPDDTILYAPMTELAMRNLRPGQELTLKTFDPITQGEARIRLHARGQETVEVEGETREAMRIDAVYRGLTLSSWIDREGAVLRQETPLGWVIEACSPDTALAAVSDATPVPELMTGGGGAALLRLLGAAMEGGVDD